MGYRSIDRWLRLAGVVLTAACLVITLRSRLRAAGTVRYVANNCSGVPSPCYTDLQAAVDAASDGDEIRVAAGTYTGSGSEMVYFWSKEIVIRGGYTADNWSVSDPVNNVTILDGQNARRHFFIDGYTPGLIIDGFTMINGSGSPGASMYSWDASHLTIRNCVFRDNNAPSGAGGALYFLYGDYRLIEDNAFYNNSSTNGAGAMLVRGVSTTIRRNRIYSNTVSDGRGAGILVEVSGAVLIENNFITNNTSQGGGLPTDDEGNGIYVLGVTSAQILHNTIVSNTGGLGQGVAVRYSTVTMKNNILSNQDLGIYLGSHIVGDSNVSMDGTLWNVTQESQVDAGTLTTGTVNLECSPSFSNTAAFDYHLAGGCGIDAGVSSSTDDDIDRDLRPRGSAPDIGADETFVGLTVTKTGPAQVEPGERITYTLFVQNASSLDVTFNTIITDTLPSSVSPTEIITWSMVLSKGDSWTTQIPVTVTLDASGTIENVLDVWTDLGPSGSDTSEAFVVKARIYAPLILRNW